MITSDSMRRQAVMGKGREGQAEDRVRRSRDARGTTTSFYSSLARMSRRLAADRPPTARPLTQPPPVTAAVLVVAVGVGGGGAAALAG